MSAVTDASVEYLATVLERESSYLGRPVAERLVRRMRRLRVPVAGERLLDVGCGTGTLTAGFGALGLDAVGVDVVSDFVEAARVRYPELTFRAGSAEALPFDEASFDYVVLLSLLEHVDDWRRVVSEAVRVLRPGGVLVVTTTNRWCPAQNEIKGFPAFGLYPDRLRRRIYGWTMEHRPEWVGHTHLPAYHWLSYGLLAAELDRAGADAHHWLSLLGEDDVPARFRRPVVEPLVRFALRHPVPLTYPMQSTTFLYALKR